MRTIIFVIFLTDLLVPDGETESLKIRTKSHEVLSTSKDSEIVLIDVIKKEDQTANSRDVHGNEARLPSRWIILTVECVVISMSVID